MPDYYTGWICGAVAMWIASVAIDTIAALIEEAKKEKEAKKELDSSVSAD